MNHPHRHVFDSDHGFVAGRRNQALMCRCGAFGMPASGWWQVVPKELLPSACKTLSWFHHLLDKVGRNWVVIASALMLLAAAIV